MSFFTVLILVCLVVGAFRRYRSASVNDRQSTQYDTYRRDYTSSREAFAEILMQTCALVMLADGRVTKGELDRVKEYLRRLFDDDTALRYLHLLRDLTTTPPDEDVVCERCRAMFSYSARVELLQMLCDVAYGDGSFGRDEERVIMRLGLKMRVSDNDILTILTIFSERQENQRYYYRREYSSNSGNNQQQYSRSTSSAAELANAYKILQVSENADEKEIKKSYRRLVQQYHPDKVSMLGEDVRHHSEEKFKAIQHAYEVVCKNRNIK